MRLKLAITCFLLMSLGYLQYAAANSTPILPRVNDIITAGSGYSSDSQKIAPEQCYNAVEQQGTDQENRVQLHTAISFSDLQRELNYSVDTSGGFGTFSYDAEASYLREVEDKDFSFSLNYYSYADVTNGAQIGSPVLTSTGQTFYNEGKNPYFGIVCGDEYVTEYKKGALLTMALNIKFNSHYDREQFEAHAGTSFADVFSASGEIQQIATNFNIHGAVSLDAYQRGGTPEKLSEIIHSKDTKGQFYILTCDIQHMDDCVKAAGSLLDYASNPTDPDAFPNQFSFNPQKNLATLSQGFTKHLPIRYIGLIAPPSLVTPRVEQEREQLTAQLKEVQSYQANLYSLANGYPVAWDEASPIYQGIQKLLQQSADNINAIYGPADNPDRGAMGCFDSPDSCDTIFTNIQNHLKMITPDDLKFLQPIQYYYQDGFASYFYNGSYYGHVNNPNNEDQVNYMYTDYNFTEPNNIHYTVHTTASGPGGDYKQWDWYFDQGVLSADGKTIKMRMRCSSWGPGYYNYPIINRTVSPYYFSGP